MATTQTTNIWADENDLISCDITYGPDITIASNGYSIGAVGSGASNTMNTITMGTGTYNPNLYSTSNPWDLSSNTAATLSQSGKISLTGDKADLDINGKSLKNWMEKVEERLNILTPNPELEKEWDELRRLGERYRKLEKKCQEKSEMWSKLKSLPKIKQQQW